MTAISADGQVVGHDPGRQSSLSVVRRLSGDKDATSSGRSPGGTSRCWARRRRSRGRRPALGRAHEPDRQRAWRPALAAPADPRPYAFAGPRPAGRISAGPPARPHTGSHLRVAACTKPVRGPLVHLWSRCCNPGPRAGEQPARPGTASAESRCAHLRDRAEPVADVSQSVVSTVRARMAARDRQSMPSAQHPMPPAPLQPVSSQEPPPVLRPVGSDRFGRSSRAPMARNEEGVVWAQRPMSDDASEEESAFMTGQDLLVRGIGGSRH